MELIVGTNEARKTGFEYFNYGPLIRIWLCCKVLIMKYFTNYINIKML